MHLENGVIDFESFHLTPETVPAELIPHCPGASLTEVAGLTVLRCAQELLADGARFLCEFYFIKNRLEQVLMRPLARYPEGVEGRMAQQAFRRAACERWLSARLGRAAEWTEEETRYVFPWGTVSAISHLSPRNAGDAGYICVRYGL